jgi:hypothetical protein
MGFKMDYWKKVPGIDEEINIDAVVAREKEKKFARDNADFQNLIGDLNSAIGALNDLKTQILRKNAVSARRSRKTLRTALKFIDKGMTSVFAKGK